MPAGSIHWQESPFSVDCVALCRFQEAFGVVVSVVTEDLKVVERLVHLHLLDEAMTTIAPETFDVLRQISGLENRVRLRPRK